MVSYPSRLKSTGHSVTLPAITASDELKEALTMKISGSKIAIVMSTSTEALTNMNTRSTGDSLTLLILLS